MYRTILVPLDGSPFGEHALPLALSIARRAGAAVQLVHVHPPLSAIYADGPAVLDESLDLRIKTQSRDYLDNVVKRMSLLSDVALAPVFLEGDVVPTLRRTASSLEAGLVVMTTHGRGAFGRFWLGSVADELLRDLPMPLLLIRPHAAQPVFEPEPELKHILLPLDGSALAEQMLDHAVPLGNLFGADFTLLRVVKPVLPVTYNVEGFSSAQAVQSVLDQIEQRHEQLCREAQAYLDGVARRLREQAPGRPPEVRTRVALEHQPSAAILQEAAPPIDLIALETHGRRGLSRLFLGSVADKVIRGSTLPVLVNKPVH